MKATCSICEVKLEYVNSGHLMKHNMSMRQYHERFPDAELYSDELKKKKSEQFLKNNFMWDERIRRKIGKKIRENYEANPVLREQIGKRTAQRNRGRKYPIDHRKAISKALMGHGFSEQTLVKLRGPRPSVMREKNPNWRGGKSFEPYGLDFNDGIREIVRQRNNYRCMLCGIPQESLNYKLDVHHIDYDKENNQLDNLISLCKPCHGKTHYDRIEWMMRLKSQIEVIVNK